MEKRRKPIKKKKKKKEKKTIKGYMLENAGKIQHAMNCINSCDEFYFAEYKNSKGELKTYLFCDTYLEDFGLNTELIDLKTAKFVLKNRRLRSGLHTPMGRYYAHRHLERIKEKERIKQF